MGVYIKAKASGPSLDPDAAAFLTAASITDPTITSAINTLVLDMKTANIWSKMKAIYPFVGGTATTHKWNLKDPQDTNAAFRLVFNGGWTHSATGATPNGTNAFADTFLNTQTHLSLNSGSLSYYSRTNFLSAAFKVNIGAYRVAPNSFTDIVTDYLSGQCNFRFNEGGFVTVSNSGITQGFFLNSRTASNIIKGYRSGVTLYTGTATTTVLTLNSIYLGATNFSTKYYSNNECAFSSIGDGLTDTEAGDFYTAVQAFNTTLSRQV